MGFVLSSQDLHPGLSARSQSSGSLHPSCSAGHRRVRGRAGRMRGREKHRELFLQLESEAPGAPGGEAAVGRKG